jgi:putative flippase GtrA
VHEVRDRDRATRAEIEDARIFVWQRDQSFQRDGRIQDVRVVASGFEVSQPHTRVALTKLPDKLGHDVRIRLAPADDVEDSRDDGARPGYRGELSNETLALELRPAIQVERLRPTALSDWAGPIRIHGRCRRKQEHLRRPPRERFEQRSRRVHVDIPCELRRPVDGRNEVERSQVDDNLGRCLRDRALERVLVAHVELMEFGIEVKPVAATSREVVHNRYTLAEDNQPVNEMAADESGSSADKDSARHQVEPARSSRSPGSARDIRDTIAHNRRDQDDRGEDVTRAETLQRPDRARQFARFLVVGVGNTVLSFIVYRVLLAFGAWYVVAAPLAFAAGAVNGYVLNRRWTFSARDSTRARILYVAVQVTGALSTSLLVPLFVAAGVGKVGAYLAAIPPVTVCMFVANRVWTFADRD